MKYLGDMSDSLDIATASLVENCIKEPSSEGTSGQFLATDGAGGRFWADAADVSSPVVIREYATVTHAQLLQDYNANKLTILVGTHTYNGETVSFTLYRVKYDSSTSIFTFSGHTSGLYLQFDATIGSMAKLLGCYYLQPKLTAGNNIGIANNVISADLSDYYTETEVDTLLLAKQDAYELIEDEDGFWICKKYVDGTYEAVYKKNDTFTIQTTGNAGWYRSNAYSITLPSELDNTEVLDVDVRLISSYAGVFGTPTSIADDVISYYLYAPLAISGSGFITASVKGKWA